MGKPTPEEIASTERAKLLTMGQTPPPPPPPEPQEPAEVPDSPGNPET